MKNSVPYLVAAYLGTAALYGGYLLWLLRQERRLRGRDRGSPR